MLIITGYLALGAIAGVVAGLLGVGGGIVIVPVLIFSFNMQGIDPEVLTHLAVGTSLATIVLTSISSVRSHHQKNAVVWSAFKPLALGMLVGSGIGVYAAVMIEGQILQKMIGVFAIVIALQMFFNLRPTAHRNLPQKLVLSAWGTAIGGLSALFGIGGGSMTVPLLSWYRLDIQKAVGTASACGLPIALAGCISNMSAGWHKPALPEYSIGFVYLPAFLGIVIMSVPFARVGASLAHRLPAASLKRLFALLLVFVGLRFVMS